MSFTSPKKRLRSTKKKSSSRSFVPKSYQEVAIKFGLKRPAAGFFLAPGLGKTAIILHIFKILKKLDLVDELVVLAKKKIVYHVWPREIKKWNIPHGYSIVHGKDKEEKLWNDAPIKITNYDSLQWLKKQKKWFRRKKRIMLACDESSKLKNTGTARFKNLKKILPFFARRYILTGSPAPNGLMGVFGQVYVLDFGNALGQFITHFRNEFFYPTGFGGYDWKLQKGAKKRIFERLKPLIIRYGNDQLDLPPLTFIDRFVKLPVKARALYTELEKEFIVKFTDGDIVAANAAVASGKLRQIANGGVFYSASGEPCSAKKARTWATTHDEKCASLVDLLEELNGEPALIAYEFEHDVHRIKKYITKYSPELAKDTVFITSGMKEKTVMSILRRWDRGEIKALFGHPDSIAHGLNLQGKGGIVIFFALTWNLENYEQFIQRVWRQGQKRRVLVYRIIAKDTVDQLVILALKRKDVEQQSLLDAMERHYG